MSEPATPRASRLAIAALALGILSLLLQVAGIIWSSEAPSGEAGLSRIWIASFPTALIGVAGTVTGIVALARRARPRWMGVVGLVFSAIPLLYSLLQLAALLAFLVQPTLY
ncbi:hypothetical protein [Agromyces ramosus]|uniref:hypothetical protein n=1 Tax=Agromyces ramosus TaxID=33879 RepID=UPI00102C28A6|nr:hypothetical protein [Agromyces ramosus]